MPRAKSKTATKASSKSVKKITKTRSKSATSSKKVIASSKEVQESMILSKLPGIFLIACLLVSMAAMIFVLWPFMTVLFVAAVLAIAFQPWYKSILSFFNGRKWAASLVSVLLVVIVILAPLTFFTISLGQEAVDTYQRINEKVNSGAFDDYFRWEEGGFVYDIFQQVKPYVDLEDLDIKSGIVDRAESVSTYLFNQVQNLFAGLFNVLLNFVVMLFAMYYFFRDGDKIVDYIGHISPLPRNHELEFFEKVHSMVKAIMLGVFLTAAVQGFLGGVGFAIAGISNAVFWGTAMAFASLVPMVGTTIVWIPAAIVLVILGDYGNAIFVGVWGMFVIGTVDNVLRPYLIGGKAHTYPLLTFFVVLGGIFTMGFKGVIIGPLILMVLMSFLHIYEAEYSKVLKR